MHHHGLRGQGQVLHRPSVQHGCGQDAGDVEVSVGGAALEGLLNVEGVVDAHIVVALYDIESCQPLHALRHHVAQHYQVGQVGQSDLGLERLVDILLNPAHPAAVMRGRHAGEALACQQVRVFLDAQFVEQVQKGQHAAEAGLCASKVHQLGIYGHYGIRAVGDTQLGVLHHFLDGAHGILGQELLAQQVLAELDGYLVNLATATFVLFPYMLQPSAHQA